MSQDNPMWGTLGWGGSATIADTKKSWMIMSIGGGIAMQ